MYSPPPNPLLNWPGRFDPDCVIANLSSLLAEQAFYVLDDKQRLLFWSPSAEDLTGQSWQAMADTPIPYYGQIDATKNTQGEPLVWPCADGRQLQLRKISRALFDQNGQFVGGFALLLPADKQISALPARPNQGHKQNFHGIISRSPAMQTVFQIIENAAETAATVLVRGESGSGKELVARAIHDLSARRDAPFLAINCAALSSSLLESELFGHVRGAFTGAVKDHKGLFQRAHGGTLFLDEVAELPLALQAKLLRVLQERTFIPVGGDRSIAVDVRIVAATHRSLREQTRRGEFREDLMYRLRVVPIFLPPLRERREDISLLLWHFIQQHNKENFRKIDRIDPAAMQVLLDYAWPGNVRELHNVIEYAFAVGRGAVLQLSELPPEFRESKSQEPGSKIAAPLPAHQEADAIRDALARCNGMISPAARLLGMSRATFWRKRKHYGI